MTRRSRERASSVMRSSVKASASRCCLASPPRSSNGRTAIAGRSSEGGPPAPEKLRAPYHHQPAATAPSRSRNARAAATAYAGRSHRLHLPAARAATSPGATRQTSTGSAMFLTRCRPAGSKRKASLSLTWLCTLRASRTPPGSARASSRAATFTPSPRMSPPSWTTSPTLMPMRKRTRSASGTARSRSAMPFWIATAQATAWTALGNSHRMPSPMSLTTRPPCSATSGSTSSPRWALRRPRVPCSSRCTRRE